MNYGFGEQSTSNTKDNDAVKTTSAEQTEDTNKVIIKIGLPYMKY